MDGRRAAVVVAVAEGVDDGSELDALPALRVVADAAGERRAAVGAPDGDGSRADEDVSRAAERGERLVVAPGRHACVTVRWRAAQRRAGIDRDRAVGRYTIGDREEEDA